MTTYEQIKNRLIQIGDDGTAPTRMVDSFGHVVDGYDATGTPTSEPEIGADGSMHIGWLATEYMHAGDEWSASASLTAESARGAAQLGIGLVGVYNLTKRQRVDATDLTPGEAYAALSAIIRRLAGKGGRVEDYAPGALLTVPCLVALEALERAVYTESIISLKTSGINAVLMPTYTPDDGAVTIADIVHMTADTYAHARSTFGHDIDPEDVAHNVLREIRHRLGGVANMLARRVNH